RLLDTALEVFAERGFGQTTIEQLCDAAGYTRGAFYSNFTSLDEVFLAMWEQQSAAYLAALQGADAVGAKTAEDAVLALLELVPVDDRWYRLTAEFTAHSLRNPSLRRVMVAREAAIQETILAILADPIARFGRVVPDPDALAQALVAVHDGTTVQCLLDPDNPEVWERRRALFLHTLDAYTQETQ
ncbi:MAG TPA: TetR/AcrR family transcriptional regulator, partial [Nocardioidaceae bacterium]|nr:TetR/AcrR family transcriptional regulator [Nocardioidaceae bacterium]